MAVRSKRLWGPVSIGTTLSLVYTAPDGETTLLKHLALVNSSAVPNLLSLRLNGTGGADTIVAELVPGQGSVQLTGQFIVLQPGDQLRAIAGSASVFVSGFGAQLEGVAD